MTTKAEMILKKTGLYFILLVVGIMVTAASYAQGKHPPFLQALSDLRTARWMLHNRPGNWQQTPDELKAENEITTAINEIIQASIDDGKNIDDHLPVVEKSGRLDRLLAALDFLNKANQDLKKEEDNTFSSGLKIRSIQHIRLAANFVNTAMNSNHPHYLQGLSDLRAARWMLHNKPGNWQQSQDEFKAENEINIAINEIIHASVDDGKNIDYHPPVDEKTGHGDRLHAALEFLNRAEQDLSKEEDKAFANGLKSKSLKHIEIALKAITRTIHSR